MMGVRNLFQELEETTKETVRLGDDNKLQVEGIGIVAFYTSLGKVRMLKEVPFVPHLAHNLLSLGQLANSRYLVVFSDSECIISDTFT